MSWHLEAVGTGGVRGTGSQDTMDKAAVLYRKVAENFKGSDFAKFEFPRIVKEDWPTLYKLTYAMADLLYVQQKWEQCGPAFDSVVAETPTGAEAPEAAYAAVLCYQKMYDQMYKGGADKKGKGLGPTGADEKDRQAKKGEWEKFKPKPLTDMQQGMLTAFNRYVCYIKPPSGDKEAEEQYVEVKFGRARTYFEAQHWEQAAVAFRDVAINHSDKDAATYAAQLYLESLNVLGSRTEPPRPTCFDDMLIRYRSKIDDPKDAVVMLGALAVGLASGVGLYALGAFSTAFLVLLLGIIESFEKGVKKFDLTVKVGDRTDELRHKIETILRRVKLPYELRSSADTELCYQVTVPLEFERDRVTTAILRLDPEGHAAVDWSEKKN
jgi:hypothetical protein